MSSCNYTNQISEEQCISDSLKVINENTSNLDAALVAVSAASLNSSFDGVTRVQQGHNLSVLPLVNNGTGILTVGETICPPWHIDQTDNYLYGGASYNFELASTTKSGKVELNVYSGAPKFFTNDLNQIVSLPAGWYRAVYKSGAMSYWTDLPRWYAIAASALVAFPTTTVINANPWPGGGDFATNSVRAIAFFADRPNPQPNAQAAIEYTLNWFGNGQPYYKNFYHPGGYLGVSFEDVPYTDNRVTTPSITFDLFPLRLVTVQKTMKQVSDNVTFLKHLNDVVNENPPMPGSETLRIANGTYNIGASTIGAYVGGVLLQDGRVFLSPYYSTTALIYDPKTDSTTIPAGTYPGNAAYSGGILLPDGRVFMTPFYGSNRAAIYDPKVNSLSFTEVFFTGSLPFYQTCGSVVLKNGTVFGAPIFGPNGRKSYLYDPLSNTFIYTNATFPGNFAFSGAVLLPDGKVFLIPWGALQTNPAPAYIYDPDTDTTAPVAGWPASTTQGFYGGVVMADGRVYCIPADGGGQYAYIYNHTTGTVTRAGGLYPPDNNPTDPGVQNFIGGNLLPDGRVFVSPGSNSTARIYDPRTDTLYAPSLQFSTNSSQTGYVGSVLLENGDIFIVPYSFTSGSKGRIFSYYHTKMFDKAAITGPYFNYY